MVAAAPAQVDRLCYESGSAYIWVWAPSRLPAGSVFLPNVSHLKRGHEVIARRIRASEWVLLGRLPLFCLFILASRASCTVRSTSSPGREQAAAARSSLLSLIHPLHAASIPSYTHPHIEPLVLVLVLP